MTENILITGGAGFIGSHLVDKLLSSEEKINIICVDNFDPFYCKSVKEKNILEHQKNENYSLYNVDIADYFSLRKVFEENQIDTIVHLAAKAGVRPSLEITRQYMTTNINGTVNLLELSKEFGIKKFVFGSSSSVYGSKESGPFYEEMKIDKPISPYAATKAAGEQICHSYSHLYGIKIVCLRFFTVYGPRQRPDLAIHKFSKLIAEGKEIPVFGDGLSVRDYTFVDDILQGILASIDYDKSNFEVFNLGESNTVELNYLIQLIEENIDKKAIIKRYPMQPGDVPMTFADISKARQLLGYRPTTQIEQGMKIFGEWFKQTYQLTNV